MSRDGGRRRGHGRRRRSEPTTSAAFLRRATAAPPSAARPTGADGRQARPHYHGHRDRLRERFRDAGDRRARRLRTAGTAAVPADPAPRHQADRQGADRPLRLACRRCSARRSSAAAGGQGRRRSRRARPQARRGRRRSACCKSELERPQVLVSWVVGHRLLPAPPWPTRRASSSASCSSTRRTR